MVFCGIAGTAFEIAATEVTFGLHVADHGLDWWIGVAVRGLMAPKTPRLPRDKDAAWILRRVATVSLVDIGPLDLAAGEILGVLDNVPQGVTVVRIARQ